MARSTSPTLFSKTDASVQQIEELLRRGDFSDAFAVMRKSMTEAAGTLSDALIRRVYREVATHFADVDNTIDFNRVMKAAWSYEPNNPVWQQELAALAAYGGQASPTSSVSVAPHSPTPGQLTIAAAQVDRAIRIRKKDWLPNALHAGFDTIVSAFTAYEAGQDTRARELLDGIGIRSPFLDWKLLLRGLIAYTAQEDSRAIENWSRLMPQRLPARLIAPVRAQVDTAFRSAHPEEAARCDARFQKFHSDPLLGMLRNIRAKLQHTEHHATAFRYAEEAVPLLKKQSPGLVVRLANCFYHAILQRGEPRDLSRFRRVFGPPVDDPEFFKLEATIQATCEKFEASNKLWAKYSQWLLTEPAGWPKSVLLRVLAIIHVRMSENLQCLRDGEGLRSNSSAYHALLPRKSAAKTKKESQNLAADSIHHLQLAVVLAPEWEEPYLELSRLLIEQERWQEAETTLVDALRYHSQSVEILLALMELVWQTQQFDALLDYSTRALAVHPLDPDIRTQVVLAHFAKAHTLGAQGQIPEATQHLHQALPLCLSSQVAWASATLSVLARKAQQTAEAESWNQRAHAQPHWHLIVALVQSVESLVFKLKPADKRSADQRLKDVLATAASQPVIAVSAALYALVTYRQIGIKYRGQATHEKTLLALALQTTANDRRSSEWDFEKMIQMVKSLGNWASCIKIGGQLTSRFPRNPVFFFVQAEALFAQKAGSPPVNRIVTLLNQAHDRARTSPEARHQELMSQIEELKNIVQPPFLLDYLFY